MRAEIAHGVGIGERSVFRKLERPGDELRIQRVHFSVSAAAGGLFVRRRAVQGNVAGGPVLGDFARVNFVGEVAIEHAIGPDGRAERNVRGIAAADARDNPVRLREIEARIEAERHHGGCCTRGAHARQHAENSVAIHAHVMISGGHGNHAIQMLAFDPQLIFAGSVAGVLAAFEHGDDDDFYFDWFRGRRGLGRKRSGASEQLRRAAYRVERQSDSR